MVIDLESIFNIVGSEKKFDYCIDLSDQVYNNSKPFIDPVSVIGNVVNRAGIVDFNAKIKMIISTTCDRCAKDIKFIFSFDSRHTLVTSLNDENNDDLLLVDMLFNIDELVIDDIFLNLPFKFLCKDDCKGLCPKCGGNLNNGECDCKKEIDPRLAALQQLLDNQ